MAFVGLSLQNTRFSGAVRLLLFRREWTDSVEKPATELEAGTSLGTVWKARPGYASAGAAGIGISFANLRRF